MARRVHMAASGLRISKPGHDAATAAEENLLFGGERHLMAVGRGTFVLDVDNKRISFGADVGVPPLVFCRVAGGGHMRWPVEVTVDATGFYASAGAWPNGAKPALGQTCSWVAVMRGAT